VCVRTIIFEPDDLWLHSGSSWPRLCQVRRLRSWSKFSVTRSLDETRRSASADRTARRQFQAIGQPVSRTQASDAMAMRLPRYEAKCVQHRCFQWGRSLCVHISRERSYPLPIYWYHFERQLIALQPCRWEFLDNETLQQTFRPVLSKLSKRRQISVIYPHFEELNGGVEPWLMARWKARVKSLLSVSELLFLSLTAEALQGKMCQNLLPSGGGRSLGAKISGGRGRAPPIYWYHSKGNWLRYNVAADSFYIMKLCSRLFVLYCRNCPKDDKFRYIIPILRKLGAA